MPSTVFSAIENIRKSSTFWRGMEKNTELHEYQVGYSPIVTRLTYIQAIVHLDSLDKGSDPDKETWNYAASDGTVPGDIACQYISKQLGGDGQNRNVFPLNEDLDITLWNADQDKVYSHVNQGNDRYAWMYFGIEYIIKSDPRYTENNRVAKIYYYFNLFENSTVVDALEGTLINTSPKETKENWVDLAYPGLRDYDDDWRKYIR